MLNQLLIIFILQFLKLNSQECLETVNYCKKCDPLTNLCFKCEFNNLIPDKKGGCKGIQKCKIGENYCDDCDDEEKLCKECEIGFFPDENGGCSYTDNCEFSYNGKCLKCKSDFILIGNENNFKICKSLLSRDLINCKNINITTGFCEECEEDYFLNQADKRCSKTKNCSESNYDICTECISGFYLDKKNKKCIKQEKQFLHCKQSLDNKTCDQCDNDYFLDEEDKCTNTKFCSKSDNNKCKECIKNYYLTEDGNSCSNVKHCYNADKETGICNWCSKNYYLNISDRKCYNTEEEEEYKYCKIVSDQCEECISGYSFAEDGKCAKSKNCSETEDGDCIACSEGYYLGKDGKCTDKKHCIYSTVNYDCIECEDKYVWNNYNQKCESNDDKFKNCKLTLDGELCSTCKKNYYLNVSDYLCYDNTEKDEYYKCTKVRDNICQSCEEEYFYGYEDYKCNKIKNCVKSKDENTCLKCLQLFCLDVKKGKCEGNEEITKEENKFYFRCEKTNEEGTSCEVCEEGLELNEEGLCVNKKDCIEKKDDTCTKCENTQYSWLSSCLNDDFGCVDTYAKNCLKCNNNLDFNNCTECLEGFSLNKEGECV